ncbi:hypothetical protein P691DRAFT_766522 [Macrolepiota fuliginosa MF-IS2]|uniref:Uncharacterized protein n=1 Tax=Macrolepiota fuliginosa MF-IS2 TaxID=1400762 RepID=A0A9P6BV46_9AGAR|nr:hypothetical protein P691DRAFT_766522 [Macrolepiota fuliginosa MF-IS2]
MFLHDIRDPLVKASLLERVLHRFRKNMPKDNTGVLVGMKNSLERVRYEEVNKWVIQPLLKSSKGRSLSTCEKNQLSYVTNPMNFRLEMLYAQSVLLARIHKWPVPEINKTTLLNFSIDLNNPSEHLLSAVIAVGVFAADTEIFSENQEHRKVRHPSPFHSSVRTFVADGGIVWISVVVTMSGTSPTFLGIVGKKPNKGSVGSVKSSLKRSDCEEAITMARGDREDKIEG